MMGQWSWLGIIGEEFITAYATIQNYGTLTQSKDVTFTASGEEFGMIITGDLEQWETTVVEAIWNPWDAGIYTLVASVPDDDGIDDNNSQSLEQEVLEPTFLIEGFENETFPPEGRSLTTGAWERSTNWPMFGLGMATVHRSFTSTM